MTLPISPNAALPPDIANGILRQSTKAPVRVATAAALPAYTRSGNVLTANSNASINTAGIDGVTNLALDDRVLVKNGAAGADNGIYFFKALGATSTAKWQLVRTADADDTSEVESGMSCFVSEGSANGGKFFALTTANPITLNTTSLTFAASGTSVPNATTGAPGAVQLAGDLGGTATAPVVASVNGITLFAIAPVLAVSVANQATMTGVAQTIDGVALNTPGMRVYLAAQSTPAQNGIWVVQSGAWTRPTDWATGATPPVGTRITVAPGGTTNFPLYGGEWYVTATAVIDTGTVTAYPKKVKGHGALVSGSPSALTVSNLWIAAGAEIQVSNQTTQANPVKATYTAGAGNGSAVFTGPNTVTDQVSYLITNA